jgi:hypothetical protein
MTTNDHRHCWHNHLEEKVVVQKFFRVGIFTTLLAPPFLNSRQKVKSALKMQSDNSPKQLSTDKAASSSTSRSAEKRARKKARGKT